MSCPTCDHTMHGLGSCRFWCPRCGTLKTIHEATGETLNTTEPQIVSKVMEVTANHVVTSMRMGDQFRELTEYVSRE